ncbi:MAG: hypothetical protein WD069_16100 [Planctomycetales bacterium]
MTRNSHSAPSGAATEDPSAIPQADIDSLRAGEPARAVGCPECGSQKTWGGASWCPDCGFYPKLNTRLTVVPGAPEEAPAARGLIESVPGWARVLGGGIFAVAGVSVVATLSLPAEGPARAWWSVGQCGIGLIAFAVAQLSVFFKALSISDRVGPVDVVFKPIAIWKPSLIELPTGTWRVWSAGWGLAGIVCGLAIVGGIRYSALFDDWGIKAGAKRNLVNAITERARAKQGGAGSLSDALDDFAGEKEDESAAKIPLQSIDCLIFGYTKLGADDFGSILLATDVEGDLKYVGRISAGEIPEEQREVLRQRLPQLVRTQPFVDSPVPATWLDPVLVGRMKFREWTPQRQLKQPRFEALLRDAPEL